MHTNQAMDANKLETCLMQMKVQQLHTAGELQQLLAMAQTTDLTINLVSRPEQGGLSEKMKRATSSCLQRISGSGGACS
jgi:hypothetical protein